ncbi:hypothetical protein HNQ54_003786 [Anaerocolumna cellulosilytica]|nr:hypothetical protein [Anaerocolumna cellulosilytica]
MNNLNFSGNQAGIILSVSGLTTIISSILGTLIAGKILTVNRLLNICYFLASINMIVLIYQTRFTFVLVTYLLYTLSMGCTNGCINAIIFSHEKNAKKNFSGIQMWGSIGWISAGWLFSMVWLRNVDSIVAMVRLSYALKISACISIVLFLYTFTLPHKKLDKKEKVSILPKEAIVVLCRPQNLFICVLLFIIFSSFQYYIFSIGPFLRQSMYNESLIIPLMSVAQISEALCLGVLGYFIMKRDYKFVMFVGLICNLWRFVALFLGSSVPLILSALISHGLASAFFFTTACIYLDSQCENNYARAGVQQIACILSYGMGASFGNLSAGRMNTLFESKISEFVNYKAVWLIPTLICGFIVILFVVFSQRHKKPIIQMNERK